MNQLVSHIRRLKCLRFFGVHLKLLASARLAVVLLAVLSAVLAWGTLLEASQGREYAHSVIYTSRGFITLFVLLGANVLAALLVWLPWKVQQIGFVITHVGLLVLLVGAARTMLEGTAGSLVLEKDEGCDELVMTDRSVLKIVYPGEQRRVSTELAFSPGPVDWPDGEELDFGQSRELGVKIVKFVRHATEHVTWVADDRDYEGPALRLRLDGPQGDPVAEDWLAATLYGGEAVIGPTGYQLWPLQVPSMLEDFLRPPTEGLGKAGVLSMHYQGEMHRVSVDGRIGQSVPLGDTGIQVEIAAYHPDAKPKPDGGFFTRSERPRNPLLELKVNMPEGKEPLRQVAFAKRPLLVMDGVTGQICPVRFWYHHPEILPTPGADFVQLPDGRLYCRATVNASHAAPQEVKVGDQIPLGSRFSLSILEYMPRARRDVTFRPAEQPWATDNKPEAAALLAVDLRGANQKVWLKRRDPEYGFQTLWTDRGGVMLTFDYQRQPLGYTVKLLDVIRDVDSGQTGKAGFTSQIQLIDPARGVDQQHEISMNHPLTYGKFTFYPPSSLESGTGKEPLVLTATSDPGRLFKYVGSLMICGGMLLVFFLNGSLFRAVLRLFAGSRGAPEEEDPPPPSAAVPKPLGRAWRRNAGVPTSLS